MRRLLLLTRLFARLSRLISIRAVVSPVSFLTTDEASLLVVAIQILLEGDSFGSGLDIALHDLNVLHLCEGLRFLLISGRVIISRSWLRVEELALGLTTVAAHIGITKFILLIQSELHCLHLSLDVVVLKWGHAAEVGLRLRLRIWCFHKLFGSHELVLVELAFLVEAVKGWHEIEFEQLFSPGKVGHDPLGNFAVRLSVLG